MAAASVVCGAAGLVGYGRQRFKAERELLDEAKLPAHYSAAAIARFWEEYPAHVVCRRLEVAAEVVPFGARLLGEKWTGQLKESPGQLAAAVRLKEMLTGLGPTFIKLGQALSIRPDIIPPVAVAELQKLCDSVPPFPDEEAIQTIREELGDKQFSRLGGLSVADGCSPIAAASLGQVYKCTILNEDGTPGEDVAVKVQRPDMRLAVSLDLFVVRQLYAWWDTITTRFTAQTAFHVPLVDAFGRGAYGELDYLLEGRNQMRFKGELERSMGGRVFVPRVLWEHTSKKVLTTAWVEGEKLAASSPATINRLVPVGVECFLTQLLDLGAFHCDPHPGNLLVDAQGRLVLIDFGLCADITPETTRDLAAAIVHLIEADYPALVQDGIRLKFLPEDFDVVALLPALERVLSPELLQAGSDIHKRKRHFQNISRDMQHVFFEYPFSVPDYFALMTRAFVVLEGIALAGDENFDIFKAIYPYALSKAPAIFGVTGVAKMIGMMAINPDRLQDDLAAAAAAPTPTPG